MSTVSILYTEVNIVCILVLLILHLQLVAGVDQGMRDHLFNRIIGTSILFCVVDSIWGLINTGVIDASIPQYYLLNVIYYGIASINCCSWMLYTVSGLYRSVEKNRLYRALMYVPVLEVIILMTISCFNGISFYVGEDKKYYSGPLYFLQVFFAYTPLFVSSVMALHKAFKKENYANKKRWVTLGLFPVFPIAFGIVQIFFLDFALISVGVMLGLLMVYVNRTDFRISLDALTQINNRNQLLKNLSKEMSDDNNRESLYLFILDADDFKNINDIYGHAEGDNALVRIADILKEVAQGRKGNCSIYRFGGDEFIMLAHLNSDEEADCLVDEIARVTKQSNLDTNSKYDLSLSVGYARYIPEYKSIPDFIKVADKQLYIIKNNRKSKR